MKLLTALLAIAMLGACDSQANSPTVDKRINADVDGFTGSPQKFYDAEVGVTCYYISYRAISCVKTN